jgi:hypothetical protein
MDRTEAVSRLLRAVGLRAPQSDTSSRNAVLAWQFIEAASADVQRLGWPENTEDRVELVRNSTTNQITDTEMRVGLADNIRIISLKPTEESQTLEINRRGSSLYWRDDSISTGTPWTRTFDDDVVITRILLLPFELLPDHLSVYIVLEAAKESFTTEFGTKIDDFRRRRELKADLDRKYMEAKVSAESHKNEKQRTNILATPQAAAVRGRRRGYTFGNLTGTG